MCGFCNVWVCVCVGFVLCGCVCFVMCGCVCVCVCVWGGGGVMGGGFGNIGAGLVWLRMKVNGELFLKTARNVWVLSNSLKLLTN